MFQLLLALAALPAAAPCHVSPPGGPILCCAAACSADSKEATATNTPSFLIKVIDLPSLLKPPVPKAPAKTNPPPPPKPATAPASSAACVALNSYLTADVPNARPPTPAGANHPDSIDANSVIALLGHPSPLTLIASGSKILVYSSTLDAKLYSPALKQVQAAIKILPPPEPKQAKSTRKIELAVPLSASAASFSSLDKKFQATLEYPGMLQIAETSTASCPEWLAMLDSVENSSFGSGKESRVSRLFYLQGGAEAASAILGSSSRTGSPGGGAAQIKSDTATGAPAGPTSDHASTSQTASLTGKPDQASTKKTAIPNGDLSVNSLEQDLVVFGGDDEEKIRAAKRVLAMLDLPRPEMIINAWVLQMSTNNPNQVGEFDQIARRFVAQNNDVLQRGIAQGWLSLRVSIRKGGYFDPDFYTYLTTRYIADLGDSSAAIQQPAILNEAANRATRGICPKGQYCLGYTTLFTPLKPRLTDLLLAMIASQDPTANQAAVDAAEGKTIPNGSPAPPYPGCSSRPCDQLRQRLGLKVPRCKTNCKSAESSHPSACGARDIEGLIESAGDQFLAGQPPQLQLECVREAIKDMTYNTGEKVAPMQALARAALADFLFNYKASQQYPEEFSPYDLTESADSFNTALSPFTDAFNRDIAAYQEYLNNVVSMAEEYNSDRSVAFTNSGLVSVRTVSSKPTKVSSTTQSFLDASSFPDLATLAANISGAQSGGGKSGAVSGVLADLTPSEFQVLTGALKSFQSSQAQIGRAINLQVTPRALSGASSAEMDITLNVDDQGTPSRYRGTSSEKFNLSRVATQDTVTHVRVDSLKLFEVSAVGAKLTLSRPPIPLILPGVELPYIGSIVGLPRKPAQEYHSGVAIMSAIVVPTAADLAYGLQFVDDRIVVGPESLCLRPWASAGGFPYCKTGAAASENQLEGSITAFHRLKKECIATGGQDAYGLNPEDAGSANPSAGSSDPCVAGALTFDKLPPASQ